MFSSFLVQTSLYFLRSALFVPSYFALRLRTTFFQWLINNHQHAPAFLVDDALSLYGAEELADRAQEEYIRELIGRNRESIFDTEDESE